MIVLFVHCASVGSLGSAGVATHCDIVTPFGLGFSCAVPTASSQRPVVVVRGGTRPNGLQKGGGGGGGKEGDVRSMSTTTEGVCTEVTSMGSEVVGCLTNWGLFA
eukprot:COSAG06_NODE_10790_length_1615_cov_1.979551_1_plen_104_part_10